jgi:hypothetical protein
VTKSKPEAPPPIRRNHPLDDSFAAWCHRRSITQDDPRIPILKDCFLAGAIHGIRDARQLVAASKGIAT